MRRIVVIGIGTGNPDHLTVEALNKLQAVDVVFLVDKGNEKAVFAELRRTICTRYIKKSFRFVEAQEIPRDRSPADYDVTVEDWHAKRAALYERMIRENLADNECGAFLVWGDASLYDSTLRLLDSVATMGTVTFEIEVIPGDHQHPSTRGAPSHRSQWHWSTDPHYDRAAARRAHDEQQCRRDARWRLRLQGP